MRRTEDKPIKKRSVNFFAGDFEKLQDMYPRIGASKAVRDIVHAHIRKIEEDAAQKVPLIDQLDLEEYVR